MAQPALSTIARGGRDPSLRGPAPAEGQPERPATFLAYLERCGMLDRQAAARAEAAIAGTGQAVDTVLLELGLLAETDLAAALAGHLGLELARPEDFPAERIDLEAVPPEFWTRTGLLPLRVSHAGITVATWRPLLPDPVRGLAFFLGRKVAVRVAVKSLIERELARLQAPEPDAAAGSAGAEEGSEEDVERLRDVAREEPVIRLVGRLIAEAALRRASDIHIEPLEDHLRVRFRIDGALETVERLDRALQAGVISRIKILAKLNIAERRLPQDGRFKLAVRGSEIDFRISTVPALHGESVVLRLLDRREMALNLPALGFPSRAAGAIGQLIGQANGIVLVTGPTGSGKTTTLYAMMTALNSGRRKILTIEDPVEYHLPGVNQIQVKPQIGLDFASALRAFLRQDPDVIMVGEIRDGETARIATQASLTGHLVLSTVHTNSAAATLTRLIDMGVEDYLLVSTLKGVIAQRLVRRLCPACSRHEPARPSLLRRLAIAGELAARLADSGMRLPVGCPACQGVGYRGRTTISEVLTMAPEVQECLLGSKSTKVLDQAARAAGMESLLESGLALVEEGATSLDEILKAAGPA